MRKFFAQHSHTNTNTCPNTFIKCSANRQSINKIVKSIPKNNHPGNSGNHAIFPLFKSYLMIMAIAQSWFLW